MLTTGAPLPATPTSPNLAVQPGITPVRRAPLPRVAPTPPGRRLRAAVRAALSDLDGDARTALVVGLAWTAAAGETCMLVPQVTAVRRAVDALDRGDLVAAKAALTAADDGLHDAPALLPVPRGGDAC
ncbi:hypothetical protein [Actinokineospora bangkokensis]|uniref:Uncharacterized protein n=1 Tax=Actinokineospora bangkokensis TaxID=1193682 RepID=A0A1Q9LPT8_9PSEU|nr:hypothetical protein [Actinokineospora bangkokensis]OLR94048.1 hypothetical protein BJP25_13820 [Actinokineospora bangkokensis]